MRNCLILGIDSAESTFLQLAKIKCLWGRDCLLLINFNSSKCRFRFCGKRSTHHVDSLFYEKIAEGWEGIARTPPTGMD